MSNTPPPATDEQASTSAPPPHTLEDASEARKSRLLALRRKRDGDGPGRGDAPVLSTRNFDPVTRTLRKRGGADENGNEEEDTVEKAIQGVADMILAEDAEREAQDLDITTIAPKRANWDLKRELGRKTAKLERKTQEAIHTLIRQRLMAQKGEAGDVVGAMRAAVAADDKDDSDDE